jgi:GNAT superfamily N-acetyltransferase
MITFSTEPWDLIKLEILPLWQEHHAAIADPDDAGYVPLDPDWAKYQATADRGALHITAARDRGALVGYAFAFIETGLHYKSTLFGHFDLYWMAPGARGHWVGIRLFKEVERAMKARGVQKMTNARKIWHDTGPIFRRLDWRDVEVRSTKWIGV